MGLQNNPEYRVHFLTRTLFSLIPVFAILSFWHTIYTGKETAIAGYMLAQMIFFNQTVAVANVLTA